MLTIKQIVIEYLKDQYYEGLYHPGGYCACALDSLMPCELDSGHTGCKPAIKCPQKYNTPHSLGPPECEKVTS